MPQAQAATTSENQVKAVWVYTLIDWVAWRNQTHVGRVNVCSIGKDGVVINLISLNKTYAKKAIIIPKDPDADLSGCLIVYIAESEINMYEEILRRISNDSILTISSIKDFSVHMGMIELVTKAKNVHLKINLATAIKSGIIIDSDVRSLSEVVE